MKVKKRLAAIALAGTMLFTMVPPVVQAEAVQAAEAADAQDAAPHNLALGLHYEFKGEPNAARPDKDFQLTNGNEVIKDSSDPSWVGFKTQQSPEIIFDLGEKKSLTSIKARFLQDWPKVSLVPLSVSFYVSDDGENWAELTSKATQLLWWDTTQTETFAWDGQKDGIKGLEPNANIAYAKYVKVSFPLHTHAWSLIDEIEIWGTDGKADGAITVPPSQFGFLQPGEATGGIHNLGLLYNGHYPDGKGNWSVERMIPNLSYVDRDGQPKDQLFDGVALLGLQSPNNGRDFDGNANPDNGALKVDWDWYLNKTFGTAEQPGGDLKILDEATAEVANKLNKPGMKEKVVLMIPNPGESITKFGEINGENLNFNASSVGREQALANREKAVAWWIDQLMTRWNQGNYSNLELVGLYWLEEQISTSLDGPALVKSTSALVHQNNLKLFWIPHFLAYKYYMWKDVGIDAVAFQPNYMFEPMDHSRLPDSANIAKQFGMSNEIEFDDRMITDPVFRERFVDYLNNGASSGLMQEGFLAYYQGNNAVYNMAMSKDSSTRILYEWLYQFAKGEYKADSSLPPAAEVLMNGKTVSGEVSVPFDEKVSFTWNVQDENNGDIVKTSATFDGKAYNAGEPLDLADKYGKHELIVNVTTGKTTKTSVIINVTIDAKGMKTLMDRYVGEKRFSNPQGQISLYNHLEMMDRAADNKEQFTVYLQAFNAKLEQMKADNQIDDAAYKGLKNAVLAVSDNLALHKEATASSIESARPDYDASKVVDGNTTTRWASNYNDDNWLIVDLGQRADMNTIVIDWEFARAQAYKLLVSDDGQTWRNVFADDKTLSAPQGKQFIEFDKQSARYVKMQGIQRATGYGYSIYELAVYNLSNTQAVNALDGLKATVDAAKKQAFIEGLVMDGTVKDINLRIVDPQGKDFYETDMISSEAGSFKFSFAINSDVEGVYTAYLKTDGMEKPVQVTFEYKKDGNGGENGGANNSGWIYVPAPDLFQPAADGSVKASVNTKLDGDSKVAVGSVTAQDLQRAVAQAQADKDGKRKVIVELKKNDGATGYALDLPASYLQNEPNLLIEVVTPQANVVLNGQMLEKSESAGQQLRFVVRAGDAKAWNEDVQEQVGSRPIVQLSLLADGKPVSWSNEKAPIVVTIPYTLSVGEQAAKLSIVEFDAQGKMVNIANAVYSAADKQFHFQTDHTGTFAVVYNGEQPALAFTDLGKHKWAQEAIAALAAKGIVKGTSSTTFTPAEEVSRADFILMLVRALDLKADFTSAFADITPQDYYYEAVSIAKQLGIVTGVDSSSFAPEAAITRQDMMAMAARALKVTGAADIAGKRTTLDSFKDADQVSGYAAANVAGMVELGLIEGSSAMIKPRSNATRAETAVFLYRILNMIK